MIFFFRLAEGRKMDMTSRVPTFGSDFLSRLRNLTFLTWSVGWCSFPCQKLLLVLYSFNSNPPVVRLNIILSDASCVPTRLQAAKHKDDADEDNDETEGKALYSEVRVGWLVSSVLTSGTSVNRKDNI